MEKVIEVCKDCYDVEVKWYFFFLNLDVFVKGVNKKEYYRLKFGEGRMYMIVDYVGVVFVNLGYKFFIGGEMGSILDSYWLIEFVGR